jgi:hypothetical protein
VRSRHIVGVITEADVFHAMMEALGGRLKGLRVTIRLHEDTGELGAIADGVMQLGGKLLNLSTFWGADPFQQTVTLKVQGVDPEELLLLLEKHIGVQVIDLRQCGMESAHEHISVRAEAEIFSIQHLGPGFIRSMDSR